MSQKSAKLIYFMVLHGLNMGRARDNQTVQDRSTGHVSWLPHRRRPTLFHSRPSYTHKSVPTKIYVDSYILIGLVGAVARALCSSLAEAAQARSASWQALCRRMRTAERAHKHQVRATRAAAAAATTATGTVTVLAGTRGA